MFYVIAAVISLVFIKKQRLCNTASNLICAAGSVFGMSASILKIFSEESLIAIHIFQSSIPFISADIKIDNLSAFFVLSLSILVFCVSLYSIGYISTYVGKRNVGLFNFLYSTFILSMFFVMTSGNAVFFLLAWEAMALISYFLVVYEGEYEENQAAGTLYIIMTHVGTVFLMIGLMLVFSHTKSFDIFGSSVGIPILAKNIIFILFLVGFGAKAGVIPLHIWLPYAHPAAPSNVSALMSGVMIKTAVYGIFRFIFFFLGAAHIWWGITIVILGVLSTVLGVAYAYIMSDMKKTLAYSSIENIGIIFIGLGVSFIALAQGNLMVGSLAAVAALLHTFNHSLFKGSLFLGVGSIQYSTHTKNIEKLGGLIKKMPITALFVLGGAISISSIVPFNGFIGEWFVLQSLFANIVSGKAILNLLSIISAAALALAGALAIATFVKLYGISFLGLPRSEHALQAKEVPVIMNIGVGIPVVLCLIIGVFPMLLLRVADKVVFDLLGVSLFGQLKGGLMIVYHPLKIPGSVISPAAALIALTIIAVLAMLVIRVIGGKYIERRYGTWDCGFEALNSRMQYSGEAFSNPIKIVFRMLFRPSNELRAVGGSTYFPESLEYVTEFELIFEKYIYNPAVYLMQLFSNRAKVKIQAGSIHSYLIYIFVTLIVLMTYNRFA